MIPYLVLFSFLKTSRTKAELSIENPCPYIESDQDLKLPNSYKSWKDVAVDINNGHPGIICIVGKNQTEINESSQMSDLTNYKSCFTMYDGFENSKDICPKTCEPDFNENDEEITRYMRV